MITVPTTLTVGAPIQVSVSGSSRTNQTIDVTVDDGEGNRDTIHIAIDGDGNGSTSWVVPDWDQANFTDGHCDAVVRTITAPLG